MKKSKVFVVSLFVLLIPVLLSVGVHLKAHASSPGSPGSPPPNGADLRSNIPSVMVPGKQYNVSVEANNTGSNTWTKDQYRLGSADPRDNTIWGIGRVALPNDVAPGGSVTFNFTITAPTTRGSYSCSWQMVQETVEWFGNVTPAAVRVTPNAAEEYSFSIPRSMIPGQHYNASVTMKNTGSATWTKDQYRLGSADPRDNTTWGVGRVALPKDVAPGESVTFEFTITAPTTRGLYSCSWQMVQETVEWFGGIVQTGNIYVSSDNAQFLDQSIPASMTAGQSYPVSMTFKNVGITTWTASNGYSLNSLSPLNNTTWGVSSVALPKDVAPGDTVTFQFTVSAPSKPGNYNFAWGPTLTNIGQIGDAAVLYVTVS